MVWVSLFDNQGGFLGCVQLLALLVTSSNDYRCMPHGMLSFESVAKVTDQLRKGSASGEIDGCHWHRQTVIQ
jgi:hypothetical protein